MRERERKKRERNEREKKFKIISYDVMSSSFGSLGGRTQNFREEDGCARDIF
jgi:hypothetical protein